MIELKKWIKVIFFNLKMDHYIYKNINVLFGRVKSQRKDENKDRKSFLCSGERRKARREEGKTSHVPTKK